MIAASAPAKIILLGEHAVVYGQPAIAVPVSQLRATAMVEPNPPHVLGLRIVASDLGEMLPVAIDGEVVDHALTLTARLVLDTLQLPPPNVTITVQSAIPVASGLGSGAAVSTALARALLVACNRTLPDEVLNRIIFEAEKRYHGTPSGIDNTVVVYEQPVYFVREQPIERLHFGAAFRLLIGDTGVRASTKIAVGDVRVLHDADPTYIGAVLDEIGQVVRRGRVALETGDTEALATCMNKNHRLLQILAVSSPELDQFVESALAAGALGVKLSGGGRGGNMIALVTDETAEHVRIALMKVGAVRVMETTLMNAVHEDIAQ